MLQKLLLKEFDKKFKIADKITSVGKAKSKQKEQIFIPSDKRQQIIDDLRLF